MTEAEALGALVGFATYLLGEAQTASLFPSARVSLLSLQINVWFAVTLDLEVLNNFPFK